MKPRTTEGVMDGYQVPADAVESLDEATRLRDPDRARAVLRAVADMA